MQAEVIAIGDELTSGQRLDTNSQWLSQQLGDLGIRTLFHTTVADDIEANIQAFRQAASRVDFVICTGGLGPTADDLTRQAIGDAFELPLELDEDSLAHIRGMFESRGREMPERNRVQALFPAGSQPIPNPHGTAPGIDLTFGKDNASCRIFSLPGVPAEMREMWTETVLPQLKSQLGNEIQVVKHFRLKCFGTGESALEAMLPDLIRRGREPTVGITVSQATITLRTTARAASEAACLAIMQPTIETIRECLGDLVFGEEDDQLEHVVTRTLVQRRETVALAEWGTGGEIAECLSALPESGGAFRGGHVVTSQQAAQMMLGVVPNPDEEAHTKAMAAAIREKCDSDYGLAMSAFPNTLADPQAQIRIALATEDGVTAVARKFAGHPDILKTRAAKQALDVLRLHLLGMA